MFGDGRAAVLAAGRRGVGMRWEPFFGQNIENGTVSNFSRQPRRISHSCGGSHDVSPMFDPSASHVDLL